MTVFRKKLRVCVPFVTTPELLNRMRYCLATGTPGIAVLQGLTFAVPTLFA
jgi:hypothetical protein